MSMGITGRRGIRSSPFDLPFRIVASMTLSIIFLTRRLVPLHIRGGLMRRRIMDAPILRDNICYGTPGISNELKKFKWVIHNFVHIHNGIYRFISCICVKFVLELYY